MKTAPKKYKWRAALQKLQVSNVNVIISPASSFCMNRTLIFVYGDLAYKLLGASHFLVTTRFLFGFLCRYTPKRSATMLDSCAQLFQHCWGHARALHMVSLEFTKSYLFYPSDHALHVPTMLEVVASILHVAYD